MDNLVFDWDWVIDDSFEFHFTRFNSFSWLDISEEEFRRALDGNAHDAKVFEWINPEAYQRFIFEEHSKRKIAEAILSELDKLRERSILSICSSWDARNIDAILATNNARGLFSNVLWREHGTQKVDKLIDLKWPGINCFVTDTLWDINEWLTAGYETIWITWGYHSRDVLESWKPSAIVEKFQDIHEAIFKEERT